MTDKTPDDMKPEILDAVLAHVPFDGWSQTAADRAAADLGIDPGIIKLAFPGGPVDLVAYFSEMADARLADSLKNPEIQALKLRTRITLAVRRRIEDNVGHREAARRAMTLLALPTHAAAGLEILYRTVDSIWHALGDTSTDYNYYTKRMTLAAVFSATLLYWLNDESEGFAETWAFLDRRIEDVMKIEKCKTALKKPVEGLPDIWGLLGRLRYPRTPRSSH